MKVSELLERKNGLESDLDVVLATYLYKVEGAVAVSGVSLYGSAVVPDSFAGILVKLDVGFSDGVETIEKDNELDVDDLVRITKQANQSLTNLVYNFQRDTQVKLERLKLLTYPNHKFKATLKFPEHPLVSESNKAVSSIKNFLKSFQV